MKKNDSANQKEVRSLSSLQREKTDRGLTFNTVNTRFRFRDRVKRIEMMN